MEQPQEQPQAHETQPPRPSRRRWWAWGGALVACLLLAAVAVPFLFTTQIVRYVLRKTHGEFAPVVERATLGVSGSLTIFGLRLHEPGDGGKPLLSADRVRIHFGWGDVRGYTLDSIDARNLHVHVRSDDDHPLTLLALAPKETDGPTLWFDRLTADGQLVFDSPGGLDLPVKQLALDMDMRMEGARQSPSRRIRVGLGEAGPSPRLLVQARADEKLIRIEEGSLSNVDAVIPADVVRAYVAGIPEDLRGSLTLRVDAIDFAGTVAMADPLMPLSARGEVRGLSLTAPNIGGERSEVLGLTTAFSLNLPMGEPSLAAVSIPEARTRIDSLRHGTHAVRDFTMRWSLKDAILSAQSMRLSTLKSNIEGGLSVDLAARQLVEAKLDVHHLDLRDAAARLAAGTLDASGTLAAHITVQPEPGKPGQLRARIDADIRDLETTVTADVARQYGAALPAEITGPLRLSADGLQLQGQLTFGDPRLPVSGTGKVMNLSVSAPDAATAGAPAIKGFSGDIAISLPAGQPSLAALVLRSIGTSFNTLKYGPLDLRDFSAAWSLEDQIIKAGDVKLAMGDSTLNGSASFDLAENVLREMAVDVTGVDVQRIVAMAVPEALDVRGTFAGRFVVRAELDPATRRPLAYSGEASVRGLSAKVAAEQLRPHAGELLEGITGLVELSAEAIETQGRLVLNDPKRPLSLSGAVRGLSLSAPDAKKEDALALQRLVADFTLSLPLAEPALAVVSLESSSTMFDALTYGSFDVRNFSAAWSLKDQVLHARQAQWNMYKAAVDGQLRLDLESGVLHEAKFSVAKLDLHDLVGTLMPGKMDAQGVVSGTIALHSQMDATTGTPTPLRGEVKLTTDSPGKLMIGDVKPLQQALTEGKSEELTDVILAQLKNYPYESGSATLTAARGQPELILSFQRKPVQPGEPGHNAQMDYEGRKVTVNYTVQISQVVIAMPQETLDGILLLASGLRTGDRKPRR